MNVKMKTSTIYGIPLLSIGIWIIDIQLMQDGIDFLPLHIAGGIAAVATTLVACYGVLNLGDF